MEEIYFKVIFGLLILGIFAIRIPYGIKSKKVKSEKMYGKSREIVLTLFVTVGTTIFPLIWIFSNFLQEYGIGLNIIIRLFGFAIGIFSLWYFYWIHKTLGDNWSGILEIRKNHTLVKKGPYKRIRHPMYLQMWLFVIAQFLISSNWIVGSLCIISWATLYFVRVGYEEKMLEEIFGEEYIQYKKETGRVLPKLRKN
jgi:protein-S-isoprenylcysteine O-methyltransferase Ste14